jgi:hypothetical protein
MQQFVPIICVIMLMTSLWLGSVSLCGHSGDNSSNEAGLQILSPCKPDSAEKYSAPLFKILLTAWYPFFQMHDNDHKKNRESRRRTWYQSIPNSGIKHQVHDFL